MADSTKNFICHRIPCVVLTIAVLSRWKPKMAELQLIRVKEVKRRTGLSVTSIYRAMNAEQFPRQVSLLGRRHVAWIAAEVDRWIEERIAAARNPDDALDETNGREVSGTKVPSATGPSRYSSRRKPRARK
jgi:prophage regulatory protein